MQILIIFLCLGSKIILFVFLYSLHFYSFLFYVETSAAERMSRRQIPWPGGPSIKQNFSLPSSIIYYMAMNPSSPEVYNKLIECCKYFFEKNPILVVQRLEHFYGEKMYIYSKKRHRYDNCYVYVNLKKIASRFWLTGKIFIDENKIPNITSTICSKLFRCDIFQLGIYEKTIVFDDFKILTNSVKRIFLGDGKMLNNDGSTVNLDKIVESVPNVKQFTYVSFYDDLGKLGEFSNFIKKHENLPIKLDVFPAYFSDEYRAELDALVDTLIESGISNRIIEYEGQDVEKFNILWNRYTYKPDAKIEDDVKNVDENANGVAPIYEDDDNFDGEDDDESDDVSYKMDNYEDE